MEKFKITKILSVIYSALWGAFLLISIIGRLTYNASSADALGEYMDKGIYNVFVFVAAAGLLSALSSLFCVLLTSKTQTNPARAAFALSIITNVLFVLSFVLLFLINKDWIVFAPILWAICLVGTSVMLVAAQVTTAKSR